MDSLAVKYLLDLAECRSFSQAAEDNYISQSSFSKTISKLEKDLDVQLVDRKQHPVALTPAGECFCQHFRQIDPLFQAALKDIDRFRHHKELQVLLCPNSYPVVKAVQGFMEEVPNVHVQTMSTNQFGHIADTLERTGCDFALTAMPLVRTPQYRYTKLYDDQLFLAVSRDNPLAGKESVSFQDLAGQVFEVNGFSLSLLEALQEYFHFELTLKPKWDLMNTRETIVHDVIRGRGVSVFAGKDVSLFTSKGLVLLPFREFPDFPFVLLEKASAQDSRAKGTFRSWMQKHLESYVCLTAANEVTPQEASASSSAR